FECGREASVQNAFGSQGQYINDPPNWIDHCRNAGIRRPHQRQPLGDCEKPTLLEMLVRTRTDAEPTIVCDVHEPSRLLATRDCSAGKNCLVTDERQHFRRATDVHRPTAIPEKESAYTFG